MYTREQPDCPEFRRDAARLQPRRDAVRPLKGRLLGRTEAAFASTDREVEMDALASLIVDPVFPYPRVRYKGQRYWRPA